MEIKLNLLIVAFVYRIYTAVHTPSMYACTHRRFAFNKARRGGCPLSYIRTYNIYIYEKVVARLRGLMEFRKEKKKKFENTYNIICRTVIGSPDFTATACAQRPCLYTV